MIFWVTAGAVTLMVVALLALTLARAGAAPESDERAEAARHDLRVYRDQLREIERDLARGTIAPADAERLRTEVSRRVLEADRMVHQPEAAGRQPRRRAVRAGAFIAVLAVAPVAVWTYLAVGAPGYPDMPLEARLQAAQEALENRPAQAEAEAGTEASAQDLPDTPERDPQLAALVAQLRAVLADRPDDLQGHLLLAQNEARLGNYGASWRAQEKVIAILGDAAGTEEHFALAEMMIIAAGGYVSPQAEAALDAVLRRDPQDGGALFYMGLMYAQNGRPDITFNIWRHLHDSSPADAPWMAPFRAQLEDIAALAGERYTLPAVAGASRGPSAEDMAAAAGMDPEAREAMIGAMVDGLAARLAAEGGPPQDWARLIAALGVLGETGRASAIWEEAQVLFGADPDALEVIRGGAASAGVAQ